MSINIDGREWEEAKGVLVPSEVYEWLRTNDLNIFKPVKQEPKWEVTLNEYNPDGCGGMGINFYPRLPRDQAQLIKEAIQATMEYLMGGRDSTMVNLARRFKIVRHSMRENN